MELIGLIETLNPGNQLIYKAIQLFVDKYLFFHLADGIV